MKRPRRALGCSVVAAVVLATGLGLFYNGYGPMALMDRGGTTQLSPGEAKADLDGSLQAAMGAVVPPMAYFGGFYAVDRRPEHADGEPSLLSGVREVVSVRTKVTPAKVPVLLDRMRQVWGGQCRPEVTGEAAAKRYTDLNCSGRGDTLFTLSVVSSTTDSTVQVFMSAEVFTVRYQPGADYGVPPIGERPTGQELTPDVDDPYWSH
ncbi:hypothetical protein ACIRYZ_10895 [Kitasatospora sp. NPDC101155]|uniref:hypothetical protein n=1 Tax=Kitasatospora sp. NPDC101155 TaxID=3364097 RepID=UPI00382F1100